MTLQKNLCKTPLSKGPKFGFQDQISLNAGQMYCRVLQGEHAAILLTFSKLQFVIKIFVWSNFEWPFYTDFTVYCQKRLQQCSPFITLCLGPMGMDSGISELCFKGKILQRNYRKMTISWLFFSRTQYTWTGN